MTVKIASIENNVLVMKVSIPLGSTMLEGESGIEQVLNEAGVVASGNASAAGKRLGGHPTRITGKTIFRPTDSGAAGIQVIGVRIVVNILSRSSGIGKNSVNVTGSGG